MPRRVLSLLLCLGGLCLAVLLLGRNAWAEERTLLDLPRLESLALSGHPLIQAARSRQDRAEAKLAEARSGFGPKLDAGVAGVRVQDAPQTLALDPMTGKAVAVVPLGYRETYKAALTLTQVLYSGGSLTANRKAAEFGVQTAEAEGERTVQAVLHHVRSAFYAHQRAAARKTVALQALDLAKQHLQKVQAFHRAGVVAKNEVLRVQVSVSNAELDLIRASSAVAQTWTACERAVGAPLSQDSYVLPPPEVTPPVYDVPGDPVSLAETRRPELKGLASARNQALQVAEAAAGQGRPQLLFQGEANVTDDGFWPTEQDDYRLALNLQWRFFDFGETEAKVRQGKAAAQELLHQLDDLRIQVRQEVIEATQRLEEGRARVEVARTQVTLAEEDYRMALKRYEAQVGTNLDVLDARVALNNSRTQLVDAVYDTAGAISNLRYALGEPVPEGEGVQEKRETGDGAFSH